jgi:hypothetical protein
VSDERDLLRQVQEVLAAADVEVGELVQGAWEDAQTEVRATLRRLMARDLLSRSLSTLQGEAPVTPPARHDPAAPEATEDPASQRAEAHTDLGATTPLTDDAATATYLFGVVTAHTPLPRTELPRLPGGGPLRLLGSGPLAALVCDVDPATFEALRDPGPDGLDVLATAAHAHDAILARFVDAPVLPLRLGTVLADDGTVEEVLRRHGDTLRAELERITGVAEWAVTVQAPDADDEAAADQAATGGDYLRQRQAALHERDRRWARQEELAAAIHAPLSGCAVEATEVGSRPLEVAPPLLHGVYLVADDARSRFESTVAYLRSEHPEAVIEVTGPWPPYHFTSVDLSGGGDPAP